MRDPTRVQLTLEAGVEQACGRGLGAGSHFQLSPGSGSRASAGERGGGQVKPHWRVAENVAGREDGCRRPSGHRERTDAGLRAALRRGLTAGGVVGQDIFPRLEMCPCGTPVKVTDPTRWARMASEPRATSYDVLRVATAADSALFFEPNTYGIFRAAGFGVCR